MRSLGMLRVKNEARWIEAAIASILPVCDRILVMDDHSEDGTPWLAASFPNVTLFDSPFADLNECRDKNWLLEKARADGADWIVMIDGDEKLAEGGQQKLLDAMGNWDTHSISLRIPYLWDREDQIRVDGVYGEFRRHSAFRAKNYVYTSSTPGGFHCGNVPARAMLQAVTIDSTLLHFGYLHAADRARKYAWYNSKDPSNFTEDQYRHIAAGLDVPHEELIAAQKRMRLEGGLPELKPFEILPAAPPATARTMHAGPLRLEAI